MRFTIVSDVCYPTVCDGVASILTRTVQELLASGHEIQLVVPEGSEMPGVEMIELKSVPITEEDGQVMPIMNLSMFGKIKAFAPDVILFMDPRLLALQSFPLFRLFFGKARLFATFHTDNFKYNKIYFRIPYVVTGWLYRLMMNNYMQVMSVSSYAQSILEQAGVKNTAGIWSGGVDATLFHPSKRCDAFRREILQNDEETIALYVGRITREKGLERLLPLFEQAREQKVRWLMVGDGDDRKALQEQVKDLPVTFVGKQTGEDLAKAYASSDLFVFPSQTDTFGLVLIEAMASGLPVIAFNHGGVPDIIDDQINGVMLDPASDALPSVFRELVSNKELRAALAANGRASVEHRWEWSTCVNDLINMMADSSDCQTAALLES